MPFINRIVSPHLSSMSGFLNKKFVRVSLITAGSVLLFIILSGLLIPVLFEKKVKTAFINALNNNLATEVVVSQENIDLKALRYFPFASVNFKDVKIRESVEKSDAFFLEAGQISLLFNVIDLLKKDYTITKIIVADANVNMRSDANGKTNYRFWKSDTTNSNAGFNMELESFKLQNVELSYRDARVKLDWVTSINTANIRGTFNESYADLNITTNFINHQFTLSGDSYLTEKESAVSGALKINLKENIYEIINGKLIAAENTFITDGTVQIAKINQYNLTVKGDQLDIATVLQLLPERYAQRFSSWASKGALGMNCIIKGEHGKGVSPSIEASYTLENGELYHAAAKDKLKSVSLQGQYSNGRQHTSLSSSIGIERFEATYQNKPVKGFLHWSNFDNPTIDISLTGDLPASMILPLADANINSCSGDISISDFQVKGNLETIRTSKRLQNPPSGNISMNGVAFKYRYEPCTIEQLQIRAAGNELYIENLNFKGWKSNITGNLKIDRWTSILDGTGPHYVNGSLNLNEIQLNRLIESFSQDTPAELVAENQTIESKALWEKLSGNINLTIGRFEYDQIELDNLNTVLYFSRSLVSARNIEGQTKLGKVKLNATARRMPNKNIMIEVVGLMQNIDISKLFDSFNNFGQEQLTSKQISGFADLLVEQCTFQLDNNYNVPKNSIYVLSDISIRDGRIKDFTPLEELSGFVDVQELRDVEFDELNNQIEINQSVITIPVMSVRSSALNVAMTGTHTFENEIDYQFQVGLGELLGRKFINRHGKNQDFERSGNGGVNVYVSMSGTVEHPIIDFNKKGSKEVFNDPDDRDERFLDIFKPDHEEKEKKKVDQQDTDDEPLEFIDWDDDE